MKSVYFEKSGSSYFVDNETGEVKSERHSYTERAKLPEEPPFVKVYLDCLAKFKDIQFSFNPILIEFLKRTTYADEEDENGGQMLYLNKLLKQAVAKKCGVSLTRVEHAITEFVKKGYMFRLGVATYQFNADLFGKGHWNDVYKARTIQAEFDFAAGKAVAKIVRNEEAAMNKATDKISSLSDEELAKFEKSVMSSIMAGAL